MAWGRIWSAVLVQAKGWQRSFQPSMKARIASIRSRTEPKLPRSTYCDLTVRDPVQGAVDVRHATTAGPARGTPPRVRHESARSCQTALPGRRCTFHDGPDRAIRDRSGAGGRATLDASGQLSRCSEPSEGAQHLYLTESVQIQAERDLGGPELSSR